ncbi:MAG: MBL fold metallo-hydrolase [Proteobacteria bacterium]|nr:MBL fold metallo-hydrolase [Pseudomonadota bacterium]
MEIIQIPLSKMAIFAYLVGDPESGNCAVIDPAFNTERILACAREKGWTITQVINTHCHPDHTAGNAAMIKATGASLSLHRLDAPKLRVFSALMFSMILGGRRSPDADHLLEDKDPIPVGSGKLDVIHKQRFLCSLARCSGNALGSGIGLPDPTNKYFEFPT